MPDQASTDFSRRAFLWKGAVTCLALTGAGGLLEACGGSSSPAAARGARTTAISLQLDFLPLGRYAPYYYAKQQGFYGKHGLDVSIASSKGTGPALQEVVAGHLNFIFVDIPSMLDLMGKSPTPLMRSYAVLYAKAPETVFYFDGGSIKRPKDLEGKTVATSAGSTDFELFPLFAKANGIDMSKVNFKTVSADAKVGLFLQGQVDATTTYIMGLPGVQAGAHGKKVGHFTYGDYGVEVYGNGLITTDKFAAANPQAVKGFVQASLQGYQAAFKDPHAAVAAMAKEVPTLKQDQAVQEIAIVQSLALQPAQRQHGLGYQDPAVMTKSYQAVENVLHQPISKPVTSFYSNGDL